VRAGSSVERWCPLGAIEHVQDIEDSLETRADVRFHAAERRQPLRGEECLGPSQIVAAKGKVLQQIPRARSWLLGDGIQVSSAGIVDLRHCVVDGHGRSPIKKISGEGTTSPYVTDCRKRGGKSSVTAPS